MGNTNKRLENSVSARLLEDIYDNISSTGKSDEVKGVLGTLQASLAAVGPHAHIFPLHYSDKYLGDRYAASILESIVRNQVKLTTLVPVPQFLSVFPSCRPAENVLRNCGLTGELSVSFSTSLSQIPTLSKLDLSQNKLGNQALDSLLKALRNAHGLHFLDLSAVEAGDAILPCIYELTKFNTSLTGLILSKNLITDVGTIKAQEILDECHHVTKLSLADNPASAEALQVVEQKATRNLEVASILDNLLSSVDLFQYLPRKKHADLRKKRRPRMHWSKEIILLSEAQFTAQFPQKKEKSKQTKSDAKSATEVTEEEVENDGRPESPKSKQELLMKEEAEKEANLYPRARLPLATASARFTVGHFDSIGKRPLMEDAVMMIGRFRGHNHEDLYGVFDGHGGPHVAAYAAQAFPLVFAEKLAEFPDEVDKAIASAYHEIDREVKTWAHYLGSTAVIAYINHNTLYVSNVGDSRAVLSRGGLAYRLSHDHKPDDPDETARILNLGGTVHDGRVKGRLGVARAFGDSHFGHLVPADPFVTSYPLSDEDHFLILACDGVFDVYDDQDLVDAVERMIVKEGLTDPQVWSRVVVRKSLERGSDDNVSVIIISLNDARIKEASMPTKAAKKKLEKDKLSLVTGIGAAELSITAIGVQVLSTGTL